MVNVLFKTKIFEVLDGNSNILHYLYRDYVFKLIFLKVVACKTWDLQ